MSGTSPANQRQSKKHEAKYKAYRNNQVREVNKAKKIGKHLTSHPTDSVSLKALENISSLVRRRAGVGELFHNLTRAT